MQQCGMIGPECKLPVTDNPLPFVLISWVTDRAAGFFKNGEFKVTASDIEGIDSLKLIHPGTSANEIIKNGNIRLELLLYQLLECTKIVFFNDTVSHRKTAVSVQFIL